MVTVNKTALLYAGECLSGIRQSQQARMPPNAVGVSVDNPQ